MPTEVNVNISQYAVLVTDLVNGDKVVQQRGRTRGVLAAAASVVRLVGQAGLIHSVACRQLNDLVLGLRVWI